MRDEVAHRVVRPAIRNEWLDAGRLLLNAKQRNLGLEILYRPELAIDTCKAQVGDLVQLAQRSRPILHNVRNSVERGPQVNVFTHSIPPHLR